MLYTVRTFDALPIGASFWLRVYPEDARGRKLWAEYVKVGPSLAAFGWGSGVPKVTRIPAGIRLSCRIGLSGGSVTTTCQ